MNKVLSAMRTIKRVLFFLTVAILAGCNGGGDSSSSTSSNDATSTDFPYLLSAPKVTFIQNIYNLNQYDVTVELDATGPTPIYSVDLWLLSKDDTSVFDHLDLVNVGGTKWSGTTYLSLPAGNYYIDSIMIEDGDPLAGGQVKSGWYNQIPLLSNTHYVIDQRLTDWDTENFALLDSNYGVSGIPLINFTLP